MRLVQLKDIEASVKNAYDISVDIKSRRRDVLLVDARNLCIWLSRKITQKSYPQIGRHYKRDHTTIMHAYKNATLKLRLSGEYRRKAKRALDCLEMRLGIKERD